jgi:hypothetical protein
MTTYVAIKASAFILLMLIYGGICGFSGALILGPTLCPSIAPTTTAIVR